VTLEGKSADAFRAIERLNVDIVGSHSKYPKEMTLSQKSVLTEHTSIHALSNSQKANYLPKNCYLIHNINMLKNSE
tara:strand:- start:263 stop:490 length:228 start_codon:yes stop_codon:yes gene_type:complete